jgi:translation initiation factor 2 subunit 2
LSFGASAIAATLSPAHDDRRGVWPQMLNRVYESLHARNPGLMDRAKTRLPPPTLSRVGSTRTAWTNFKRICELMYRNSDHVLQFFLVELDTTGAIDGSENLLLRGRYLPKVIESILRQYISAYRRLCWGFAHVLKFTCDCSAEYVQCNMCKSLDTDLDKDADTRLFFMKCKSCGSSRSVAQIKAGHHATTRADRRRQKQLAA